MTRRDFDPASLASGLVVCGLGVLLLLDQVDAIDLRFGYLLPTLLGAVGSIMLGGRALRPALSAAWQHGDMSAASHQASQPPLRRDREGAVIAGVCAGLGRRLGIDPIVLRVVFIAATAAGGLGVGLYACCGRRSRPRASRARPGCACRRAGRARLVDGRGRHRAARALAPLLVFRQWGLWIGDGLVSARRAGRRGRRADLAPVRQRRRSRAGPRGARASRPGERARPRGVRRRPGRRRRAAVPLLQRRAAPRARRRCCRSSSCSSRGR